MKRITRKEKRSKESKKNFFGEFVKSIKEISSNLLESFRTRILTAEDISKIRKRTQIRLQ